MCRNLAKIEIAANFVEFFLIFTLELLCALCIDPFDIISGFDMHAHRANEYFIQFSWLYSIIYTTHWVLLSE